MRLSAAADSQVPNDATEARPKARDDFESMFRRHYERVYSLAYRLCGHRTEAEDLAQETFVKAARGWASFRDEAQAWSWLYRITVNAATDAYKKNRRAVEAIRQYATTVSTCGKRAGSGDDDLADRVQCALSTLPFRQRTAIVLTVCEGLSHREAADILGCSEITVSWHVHRAKKGLNRALTGSKDHE